MAKAKRKTRIRAFDGLKPTAEQMASGDFREEQIVEQGQVRAGRAFRRVPMILVLFRQKLLSEEEFKALRHYQNYADIAERSPLKDSLAKDIAGGSGEGPGAALLHAKQVRDDCERAAGSLADILRAVVVYDKSLSQWAIEQSGGLEECKVERDSLGTVVRRYDCRIKPRKNALAIAQLEIKVAAKRVMAELDAWG